jgi:hypothetical protein
VHRVSDVRQTDIHTAELLVPDPSSCEDEIAIAKLKRFKSPGSQIQAELVEAGGEALRSEIYNSLILLKIRKTCLFSGRSLLLYQSTRRAIELK